ncbi:MAG TPA: hypothetical protein VGP93_13015 [Polyangiaceae bacterium]|jgi:hypothetical protein|nr:hypothetical protein [Polyangiaceae bacterium]
MPVIVDNFPQAGKGLTSPSDKWVTVTPHDTNNLAFLPRAVACGATGGTVAMIDKYGNTSTFYMNPGDVLAVRPAIIKTTGTTATPIIALE